MILNPTPGKLYTAWYRKECADLPLHGKIVRCIIASRGKPRNHAVSYEGQTYIVPCGNLNKCNYKPFTWRKGGKKHMLIKSESASLVRFIPESKWDLYCLGRMSTVIGVSATLDKVGDQRWNEDDNRITAETSCIVKVLANLKDEI